MDNNFMPQFSGKNSNTQNSFNHESGNPFGNQSQSTISTEQNAPAIRPQPVFGQANTQPEFQNQTPKTKKAPTNTNTNLVILSVVLGVIALIAVVVAIWLAVNQNASKKTDTPVATSTAKQEEILSAKTFGFYPKKITNPTADVIYRLGVHRKTSDGNGVFGAYINTENTAVDLYIYWQYIKNYYGVETELTDRELATVTFDQPVADIAIGETGQSVGGDVLLFLMADGTVEYMPVVKALSSRDFKSYGQLAGVADVVKFYHVDAVSDTGDWSGYVTTLAQREDGSIIDLQSFMKATLTE